MVSDFKCLHFNISCISNTNVSYISTSFSLHWAAEKQTIENKNINTLAREIIYIHLHIILMKLSQHWCVLHVQQVATHNRSAI